MTGKTEVLMNDGDFDIFDELEGLDYDGPDDSGLWIGRYKRLQWNNKYKEWEAPLESWAGTVFEQKYDLENVAHKDVDIPGFLLEEIHLAVFAWRTVWEHRDLTTKQMIYADKPDFSSGQKWSKRYNILCLIRESESDEPVMITVAGYTGQYLYEAIRHGRNRTCNLIKQLTGRDLPGYLFWLEMAAGERVMVGTKEQSSIFPPVAVVPDIKDLDRGQIAQLLNDMYVGADIKDLFANGLYDDGQKWAIEKTEQLALPAGNTDTIPQITDTAAQVLADGTMWYPDLSNGNKGQWIECALSLPGLFEDRGKVNVAYKLALRKKGLTDGQPNVEMWEAWREYMDTLWYSMEQENIDISRETELRNG